MNPESRKHYNQSGVSENQETTNTKNYNFEDFIGNLFNQGIFYFNFNFDDDNEYQHGEQEDHNAQPPNISNS